MTKTVDAELYVIYTQDADGVNDNDLLCTTDDVSKYRNFELLGAAGAVDVEVQLTEGGAWSTAPLTLTDLGSATLTPVLLTSANRLYGFTGNFRAVRFRQNGATAATGYVLRCF